MSLNTIELPGFAIAGLFKNSLVSATGRTASTLPEEKGYKFLGDNRKKITLVVHYSEAVFLPEKQLTFISKILEACRVNIGDVAIVNHASAPVILQDLKKQLVPVILILFGIEPAEIKLPISFPQFKTQSYDGCIYLYTPSLDELDQNTEEGKLLKSRLWICLKALFEV